MQSQLARLLLRSFRPDPVPLAFGPRFPNSYALISERSSEAFIDVMQRLECYLGTGPVGPNKYWEFPWVLASLDPAPGMKVLDAGCGRSPLQFFMAHMGCEVHGVDPFEDVSWHGIRRDFPGRYGCQVTYYRESMEAMSLSDAFFDRVCCVSVIEHCRARPVEDERATPQTDADRELHSRIMREIVRVLRPGGRLVVTVDYNFPRRDCVAASNVNVKNLIQASGIPLLGERYPLPFPGEAGFDPLALIEDPDIDICNYCDILQTSIGFTLQKPAV